MRKENETLINFAERLFISKSNGSDIDNSEIYFLLTGKNVSGDEARKRLYGLKEFLEVLKEEGINNVSDEDIIKSLDEKKAELYKQQVKTGDIVRDYRNTLRNEARIEEIKNGIYKAIRTLPQLEIATESKHASGDKVAILNIGDWHQGAEEDNFYNKFSPDILKRRVSQLALETIDYCDRFNVRTLHVLNLGDLIEGHIHTTARISASQDAVTQVISVAELLSHFLLQLQNNIPNVVYRSCSDNHSRVTPNKKEHIEQESFGKIIDWFLKERLKDTNVIFEDNIVDYSIGLFEAEGKKIMFVHGHLDSPDRIVPNLALGLGIVPDYVIMGHYHHSSVKDIQGSKLVINGGLKGVDGYCLSRRLFNKPSQTLMILDGDNEIMINIVVK